MATLKEIAEKAGVSTITVSRVLSDKHPNKVSAETRARVLRIAEELGYRPNIAARALRERRTYQFGLVIPSIDESFIADVVQGLQNVAMDLHYSCLLYVTKFEPGLELEIFRTLVKKGADGVLWLPRPQRDPEVDRIARDLPVVQLYHKEVPDAPAILVDQEHGAYAATKHLLDLGHRRIAKLAGHDRHGRQRLAGYYRALCEAGLEPDPDLIRAIPTHARPFDVHWERARSATHALLSSNDPPTAIVCYSDLVAWGALRAAQESGVAVPESLSLVGFDDIQFIRFVEVPMTSVAQPKRELGELAMSTLDRLIRGEKVDDITLVPSLVRRASTAPPAHTWRDRQ